MRRPGRRWGLGYWLAAGLLLAVAVVAVSYLWYGYRPVSETPTQLLRVMRLTSERGFDGYPSFSPDGKQIVYGGDEGAGDQNLYIRSLDSADRVQLTSGSTLDGWPVWSPKGQEIAFVRTDWTKWALYLISYPGGSERKILDLNLAKDFWMHPSLLSWFPDGRSLAFANRIPDSDQFGILRLDLDTRKITPLSVPPEPGLQDIVPCVSPDGKRLAFVRGVPGEGKQDLWVRPIPQGEATRLNLESYEVIEGLVWIPDGRELIYIAKEMLWRITAEGGVPRPVSGGGRGHMGYLCVSPQGDRLVYADISEIWDIWRFPGPESTTFERVASELIVSNSWEEGADFSPDSQRIAFVSSRRGELRNIWICDADGRSNLRQLTSREIREAWPRWSPDGEWIVFESPVDTGWNIFVIRASGVGAPRPITTGAGGNHNASWSQDGRWIYFNSDRSGEDQIWKLPVEEGEATNNPVQVTTKGGVCAQEAPAGDALYYGKPDRSGVWKVSTHGGEEKLTLDREVRPHDWCLAEGSIYFVSVKSIQRFDLASGEITPVLERERPVRNVTVSPDGEWIVWREQTQSLEAELMLVENFR